MDSEASENYIGLKGIVFKKQQYVLNADVVQLLREFAATESIDVRNRIEQLARNMETNAYVQGHHDRMSHTHNNVQTQFDDEWSSLC